MANIIRDSRYVNTIWCLCNNYEEFLQFSKDLYLYQGLDVYGIMCEEARWIEDVYDWANIFDVDIEVDNEEILDPIKDIYEIKDRPKESEYPIVAKFSKCDETLFWVSLNDLKQKGK